MYSGYSLSGSASLCVSSFPTFAEFATEGAVKPLTTVLPAHRRRHGGSAPATALNTVRLWANGQRILEETHNHTNISVKYLCMSAKKPCLGSWVLGTSLSSSKFSQSPRASDSLTSPASCLASGVTRAPSGRWLSAAV